MTQAQVCGQEQYREKEGAAGGGRRSVAGVGVRGRIRRRDAQNAHAVRRRLTDDGVDDEVAGDRRGAGKRLHRRRPRRAVSGRRSAGPSVRHHRAATRPAVAGVGGRRAEQAGVDDGLDGRRGPRAAVDPDAAPAAASRFSRVPLGGMSLSLVSAKNVHIVDGGVASDRRLAAPNVGLLLAAAGVPLEQGDKVVPPASHPSPRA